MGDINQKNFICKYVELLNAPFLEVGSKDYGSTQDLRSLFACSSDEYIGVDMEQGRGVDIVLDLTEDFEKIDLKLGGRRFATIFCLSVLEHCEKPFKMAENLMLLLKPGGHIVVSVPFPWKIHGYPNDYWRFTPEGVKKLFYRIEFDDAHCLAATSKENEFKKLDDDVGKISFSFSKHRKNGSLVRAVTAKSLKLLSRFGVLSWLTGYRHLFAPTNISMIGRLKDT
jgi:SAM-dependent methyltransferase